jgi:hypothetical protein
MNANDISGVIRPTPPAAPRPHANVTVSIPVSTLLQRPDRIMNSGAFRYGSHWRRMVWRLPIEP